MPHHDTIRLGRFELRPTQRLLLLGGQPCRLGGRAFDVLLLLVENRHRTVSCSELLERAWPGLAVEPNNLQVQIWSLRKLLGRRAIATVDRRGYRYVGVDSGPPTGHRHAAAPWAAAAPRMPAPSPAQGGSSQRERLRWRSRAA